jgi:membrane-bound serine protease (ClpP class)
MDPLAWAAILLGIGLLLVGLEFFIPSSGLIGLLSLFLILCAIIMAFYHGGLSRGFTFIMVAAVCVPAILCFGFYWLPRTSIGKQLLGEVPTNEEFLSDVATRRNQRNLIGAIGRSITPILPSGSIEIDGQTLDVTSQGMPIEANSLVQIVDIQGTGIIVRPYFGELPVNPAQPKAAPQPGHDPFNQTLESLGIESWEEPLK